MAFSENKLEDILIAKRHHEMMATRRSVRDFSTDEVPIEIINYAIACANSAPSGANSQPWHFTVIRNPEIKRQIRLQTELVEEDFYHRRAPEIWLKALEPLNTNEKKAYLEKASTLIAIFTRFHYLGPNDEKIKTYYPLESTGIATGFLITALHRAGVATLTHTPKPMNYLSELTGTETSGLRPYMLLVAGYPHPRYQPPNIEKRNSSEISHFIL